MGSIDLGSRQHQQAQHQALEDTTAHQAPHLKGIEIAKVNKPSHQ